MISPLINKPAVARKPLARSTALVPLLSTLLLAACSGESIETMMVQEMPPPLETARFLELRSARWPGGGRELTVGVVKQADGSPFADDLTTRLSARAVDGSPLYTKVQKIALNPGYTAILLPPSQTAAERAALSQAVLSFVASRPSNERIALYRYGSSIQLFSNFLFDRTKLNEALQRYQNGNDGDANPLALLQAVGPVVSDTHSVGGAGPDVMRSVVILTRDPKVAFVDYPQVYVTAVTPDVAGLNAASAAIDAVRQNGMYKLAACGSLAKVDGKLQVQKLQGELNINLPATLPEELGAACNLDLIDSAKRSYTPVLELVFDDAQRAAHTARVNATQSATYNEALARSDFLTGIRLAPGQPAVLATAHLHGQSSLRCPRHSYTVQLEGPNRYLLPDSASDEYTLVSMCDDPAYVYAPTVYSLLSDDLFTSKFRFIEFIIDGKTQGIYMLVEKNKEELARDLARVSAVMRRQYPSGGNDAFEVLYSNSTDLTAPANRYKAFAMEIAPLSGDALVTSLRNHMDLDQYMRYLGNQSVLRSGDYIDELYLIGSEQANGQGGIGETYRFMAWDPEGYTACHSGGANAYTDPNGLAYCAEGRLDFKILPDAKVYAMFVDKLEASMNGTLSRDRMVAALTQTKTSLQGLLSTPAICAAMTELRSFNTNFADCNVARGIIATRADAILAAYDARRTALLPLIATYRSKTM